MSFNLEQNRAMSNVQPEKIGLMIYGGHNRLESLRRIWSKIEKDPQFDKSGRLFMNHSQRYVDACRKIKRFQEVAEEECFQSLDEMYDAYMAIDENLPIDVHLSMFIPIMNMHTSAEQKARWLHAAQSFRIIGAYAQTELAHGSNVRGIETTATYDLGTDEFVIHTPSLTSAKWWPGGLGHTATHAVVYANLLLNKKNLGPHPFMVQLRSLHDHTPLPGITLGDLGPKQGYNSMDNGFAIFNQVRISRMDMLMGFAQVSSSGVYTKQNGAEKIAFGIMLDVRARICINSAYVLARALTISIRYSCVRVQGFVDNAGKSPVEHSVIEYPTQQRILMPLLSMTYALHFTGIDVKESYHNYITTSDSSLLSELHATSAGLKAYITTIVSEGMESCRKMCGGHGFLVNAGFADLYSSYLPFSTLEGTKEVLQQQMGRYLLKQYVTALSSTNKKEKERTKMSPSTAYLLDLLLVQKKQYMDFTLLLKVSETSFRTISNTEFDLIEKDIFRACRLRALWCISIAAAAVQKAKTRAKVQKKQVTFSSSSTASILPSTLFSSFFLHKPNSTLSSGSVGKNQSQNVSPSSSHLESSGLDPLLAASVELCAAAEAHSELLILQSFSLGIRKQIDRGGGGGGKERSNTTSTSTAGILSNSSSSDSGTSNDPTTILSSLGIEEIQSLRTMFVLLAMNMIGRSSGQFLASGAISLRDFPVIGTIEGLLCRTVRTDSLNLVEAWQFSDERLDSTLGRADGQVYEALYAAAQSEPLNSTAVSEGYSKYLKYVLNRPPSLPLWGSTEIETTNETERDLNPKNISRL